MKTVGIILTALIYYAAIFMSVVLYGVKAAAFVILASCCVAIATALIGKDEPENKPERESCSGCENDLGGGHCRINVEGECREGGGFELYKSRRVDK